MNGLFFAEEDLNVKRFCAYYDPDYRNSLVKYSLSEKESTLYNFLLDFKDPILVSSIPASYRGALGRLKNLGLIEIDNTSIRVKYNNHVLFRKEKVVRVVKEI